MHPDPVMSSMWVWPRYFANDFTNDATDSILPFWCSPRKAALFPSSLCFLYVLIPVDASQGLYILYAYMNAKVRYVLRLFVNEDSFGISLDSEFILSACGVFSLASRFSTSIDVL